MPEPIEGAALGWWIWAYHYQINIPVPYQLLFGELVSDMNHGHWHWREFIRRRYVYSGDALLGEMIGRDLFTLPDEPDGEYDW